MLELLTADLVMAPDHRRCGQQTLSRWYGRSDQADRNVDCPTQQLFDLPSTSNLKKANRMKRRAG